MTSDPLWQAQPNSNYRFLADQDIRRIFPKSVKTGKSVPVRIERYLLMLRHNATPTTNPPDAEFRRIRHQGKFIWRVEGEDGPCSRDHVVREVARMLRLSPPDASAFVAEHLRG